MVKAQGTSGGWRGMNGTQRRLARRLALGFGLILVVIMFANVTSMISDFAAAGVTVTTAHVWLWEVSSIIAWLTELPLIWWLVMRLRRATLPYWAIALIVAAASVPASLWHIGLMVAIRIPAYAAEGQHYRFMGGIENPLLYEYRKDLGSFLQFAGFALLAQWLLARVATPPVEKLRTLAVSDGAVTHHVPVDEVDRVSAAGNYVELGWGARTLLHRATLAAVEAELGAAFVRVHRSHLVRRAAIRRIATERSGDFTVDLVGGERIRGSRRYRDGVEPRYKADEA
ncbi:LytTR family DNA-binding domain-containing protein [Sphingomonas sp. AR_OL41]|uniref:LytTR family DNA-binding domain-containing protein n=1 Tax=Sphingomonas sp. AR_OL41 TaxID=3042729 RepID=UPI00247FBD07|nr:LytTR family DNA-binding domain-containing protein [Sphingomonas sp. AR_OL41]MDH7973757.1 LytTR family DNA-binding domain-containing protein [Sphingomonas sp. AR_OL41]